MKYAGQKHAGAKVHWRTGLTGSLSGKIAVETKIEKNLTRINTEKGYHYG